MSEDKLKINNTREWYQKVHMCRRVPPRRAPVEGYDKPECYVLSLRNARLPCVTIPFVPFINIGGLFRTDGENVKYIGKIS